MPKCQKQKKYRKAVKNIPQSIDERTIYLYSRKLQSINAPAGKDFAILGERMVKGSHYVSLSMKFLLKRKK